MKSTLAHPEDAGAAEKARHLLCLASIVNSSCLLPWRVLVLAFVMLNQPNASARGWAKLLFSVETGMEAPKRIQAL